MAKRIFILKSGVVITGTLDDNFDSSNASQIGNKFGFWLEDAHIDGVRASSLFVLTEEVAAEGIKSESSSRSEDFRR